MVASQLPPPLSQDSDMDEADNLLDEYADKDMLASEDEQQPDQVNTALLHSPF